MKRILLFVMTNLAVMVVLGIVINLFGLNRWLDANGLNVGGLLMFSLVVSSRFRSREMPSASVTVSRTVSRP